MGKMGKKAPRLDPYDRLLHRFYEPLMILDMLLQGKALGPHRLINFEASNPKSIMHRLLNNLAYVCDAKKGGSSVSSIGTEEGEDRYVLWLASNEDDEGAGVIFLEEVLNRLKDIPKLSEAGLRDLCIELLEFCAAYAASKIHKEAKALSGAVKKCKTLLKKGELANGTRFFAWLDQFENRGSKDLLDVCKLAYSCRRDAGMMQLRQVINGLSQEVTDGNPLLVALNNIKHYIGRLAHHVRSVYELIVDSRRMEDFIGACEAKPIITPQCVPPREADGHTNIESILRRMSSSFQGERWEKVMSSIHQYNRLVPDDQLAERYEKASKKPLRVHSEVQVIDHFYHNQLPFAKGDRFIATSKMSCLCCKLYIRHHPLRCSEPESHEKVYPKWGPSYLEGGRDHPGYNDQRDLMNKVIADVREFAVDHLLEVVNPWSFHHDSLTEITSLFEDFSPFECHKTVENYSLGSSNSSMTTTTNITLPVSDGYETQAKKSDISEDEDETYQGGANL